MATTPEAPGGPEDRLVAAGVLIGSPGPIVTARLLAPIREHIDSANAALIFVVLVVVAAAVGGRWAGIIAAVTSALTFDFFFTHPYDTLRMNRLREVVTTALLLVVGVVVGEVSPGHTGGIVLLSVAGRRSDACIESPNKSCPAPSRRRSCSPSEPYWRAYCRFGAATSKSRRLAPHYHGWNATEPSPRLLTDSYGESWHSRRKD